MDSALVKQLASSDGSQRDKACKALKNWLLVIRRDDPLDNNEFLKLWKALFYCQWMSDKPSYQQTLANNLGDIALLLESSSQQTYIKCFWETICREWSGIDRQRLDKFYLLLRRFLLLTLELQIHSSIDISHIIQDGPLNPIRTDIPDGIRFYLIDNFLDVLEEHQNGNMNDTDDSKEKIAISSKMTLNLLGPYINLIELTEKKIVLSKCEEFLLLSKDRITSLMDMTEVALMSRMKAESETANRRNRKVLYAISSLFN
jgi:ribosomal RNA-processing protein 1